MTCCVNCKLKSLQNGMNDPILIRLKIQISQFGSQPNRPICPLFQPTVDQIELTHVAIIALLMELEAFKLLSHVLLYLATVIRNKVQRDSLIYPLTLDSNTLNTEVHISVLDEVL